MIARFFGMFSLQTKTLFMLSAAAAGSGHGVRSAAADRPDVAKKAPASDKHFLLINIKSFIPYRYYLTYFSYFCN
jgi:hypothetical protein